jgi:hypothetical protein
MLRRIAASLVLSVVAACAGDEGDAGSADTTGASAPASSSEPDGDTATPGDGDGGDDDDGPGTTGDPQDDTATGTAEGSTATAGEDTTTGAMPAELPAEVLDLTNWKLTLPIGSREAPGEPLEIFQPELATYTIDPHFMLDRAGTGVLFQAHAGGVTTSNSGYPRSELREMARGGSENAAWSTTEGVHTMTITQAITHLPEVKPHVVAGQIHDADDDVVMIRLEDTHLFVEGGGDELGTLEPDYALGTPFTVRLVASGGTIEVFYEDMTEPSVSVSREAEGCYFKAGAYTQSNLEQGDEADAYGEVVITDLVVTHE